MSDYKTIENLKLDMAQELNQLGKEHLRSLKLLQDHIEETRKHLKRVITVLENN